MTARGNSGITLYWASLRFGRFCLFCGFAYFQPEKVDHIDSKLGSLTTSWDFSLAGIRSRQIHEEFDAMTFTSTNAWRRARALTPIAVHAG